MLSAGALSDIERSIIAQANLLGCNLVRQLHKISFIPRYVPSWLYARRIINLEVFRNG
jgi:hypothetical protein